MTALTNDEELLLVSSLKKHILGEKSKGFEAWSKLESEVGKKKSKLLVPLLLDVAKKFFKQKNSFFVDKLLVVHHFCFEPFFNLLKEKIQEDNYKLNDDVVNEITNKITIPIHCWLQKIKLKSILGEVLSKLEKPSTKNIEKHNVQYEITELLLDELINNYNIILLDQDYFEDVFLMVKLQASLKLQGNQFEKGKSLDSYAKDIASLVNKKYKLQINQDKPVLKPEIKENKFSFSTPVKTAAYKFNLSSKKATTVPFLNSAQEISDFNLKFNNFIDEKLNKIIPYNLLTDHVIKQKSVLFLKETQQALVSFNSLFDSFKLSVSYSQYLQPSQSKGLLSTISIKLNLLTTEIAKLQEKLKINQEVETILVTTNNKSNLLKPKQAQDIVFKVMAPLSKNEQDKYNSDFDRLEKIKNVVNHSINKGGRFYNDKNICDSKGDHIIKSLLNIQKQVAKEIIENYKSTSFDFKAFQITEKFKELKKHPVYIKKMLDKLSDKKSELYSALNMKRYSLFGCSLTFFSGQDWKHWINGDSQLVKDIKNADPLKSESDNFNI